MQFYNCKIEHIKYTHEERPLSVPGQKQNYSFLVNHMKKKRFKYKECNSRFVKLSSFNTHMEKQHYLALHRNKITRFWSTVSVEPTTCKRKTTLSYPVRTQNYFFWATVSMKQKQNERNLCNFSFVKLNTFKTHMKRQHGLALGRHRITLFVNCIDGANYMKQTQSSCNECNFKFVKCYHFKIKRQIESLPLIVVTILSTVLQQIINKFSHNKQQYTK